MIETGRHDAETARDLARDTPLPGESNDLGPLLGLSPAVERRFEADTREERLATVRIAIPFGLVFHNLHNLGALVFTRDAILIGLALRTGLITTVGLSIWLVVPLLSARWREMVLMSAMIGVVAVPIFLVWYSHDPNATYIAPEYYMVLVYGGLILKLRFPHMIGLTIAGVLCACLVFLVKPDLPTGTCGGFILQIVTGSCFMLYGNYLVELSQRRSYLRSLREISRSEGLEADKTFLTSLSSIDPLTGVANRRAFDAALDATLRAETGDEVALLIIDIDDFKRFNDTYGHVAGDRCLRMVAEALSPPSWAGRHLVARYGGEEFAILLYDLDRRSVPRAAEAVRVAVEALSLDHVGRRDGLSIVTVSIGFATTTTEDGATATAFLGEADAGLYEAKRLGRNRWAAGPHWTDPPISQVSAA